MPLFGNSGLRRARGRNYGDARWLTMREARRLWSGPDPLYGGIPIAEQYAPRSRKRFDPADPRTWGKSGRKPLLIDPCHNGSTHSLTIAGSGQFKSMTALASLCTWTGSAVVLDPSTELAPMLAADRRRMGHRVVILDPETAEHFGFNAVDWIDIASPSAVTDARAVVDWVCGNARPDDATAAFFTNRGKALVLCLLCHLLWDRSLAPELRSLRTLRHGIVTPEADMRELLAAIYEATSSPLARDLAGTLKGITQETFSGIYTNADESTAWLSNPAYAALVSGSSFRTTDIANGRTTVFVSLPLKTLLSTPQIARLIVGSLLNAVYERDGAVNGRVLFLLDEAAMLGRMRVLQLARDAGRKYGITLSLYYQSEGQLAEIWDRGGSRAWHEGCSWRAYAGIADYETAEALSKACGEHGIIVRGTGVNTGRHGRSMQNGSRSRGENVSLSETRRRLILPQEIMTARADEVFVLHRGHPLRASRPLFFRRPEFIVRVAPNRFARTAHAGQQRPRRRSARILEICRSLGQKFKAGRWRAAASGSGGRLARP